MAIRRSNKSNRSSGTRRERKKWCIARPSGEATTAEEMSKKKKDRGDKRSTKYNGQRSTVGLEELRGYYFTHGDPGSGNKFNKTVEKIAEYCRVKVSKEIYKLVLYGEEAEFPEVEEPSGSKPSAAKQDEEVRDGLQETARKARDIREREV